MSVFSFYLLSLWNIYAIFAKQMAPADAMVTHQNHLKKSFDGRVIPLFFLQLQPAMKPALTFLF